MEIKTISIKSKYQENIKSIDEERKKLEEIVHNIYNRFINENNKNNLDYALEVLKEYRFIPNKYIIPNGRYIRYIDTKDTKDMKLKLGGFVISDNGYSTTYKSKTNLVKLSKKHCIIFVLITHAEKLAVALTNI